MWPVIGLKWGTWKIISQQLWDQQLGDFFSCLSVTTYSIHFVPNQWEVGIRLWQSILITCSKAERRVSSWDYSSRKSSIEDNGAFARGTVGSPSPSAEFDNFMSLLSTAHISYVPTGRKCTPTHCHTRLRNPALTLCFLPPIANFHWHNRISVSVLMHQRWGL